MPAALSVDWPTVRRLAEAGAQSLGEIAERFCIDYQAVKKRSQRECWLIPSRVAARAAEITKTRLSPKLSPEVQKSRQTLEIAAESLAERQNQHVETVHRIAKRALARAEAAPPAIESVSDLEKMVNVHRKALQMDTDGAKVSVNVNLWGGSAGATAKTSVLDAEMVGECPQSVSNYDGDSAECLQDTGDETESEE